MDDDTTSTHCRRAPLPGHRVRSWFRGGTPAPRASSRVRRAVVSASAHARVHSSGAGSVRHRRVGGTPRRDRPDGTTTARGRGREPGRGGRCRPGRRRCGPATHPGPATSATRPRRSTNSGRWASANPSWRGGRPRSSPPADGFADSPTERPRKHGPTQGVGCGPAPPASAAVIAVRAPGDDEAAKPSRDGGERPDPAPRRPGPTAPDAPTTVAPARSAPGGGRLRRRCRPGAGTPGSGGPVRGGAERAAQRVAGEVAPPRSTVGRGGSWLAVPAHRGAEQVALVDRLRRRPLELWRAVGGDDDHRHRGLVGLDHRRWKFAAAVPLVHSSRAGTSGGDTQPERREHRRSARRARRVDAAPPRCRPWRGPAASSAPRRDDGVGDAETDPLVDERGAERGGHIGGRRPGGRIDRARDRGAGSFGRRSRGPGTSGTGTSGTGASGLGHGRGSLGSWGGAGDEVCSAGRGCGSGSTGRIRAADGDGPAYGGRRGRPEPDPALVGGHAARLRPDRRLPRARRRRPRRPHRRPTRPPGHGGAAALADLDLWGIASQLARAIGPTLDGPAVVRLPMGAGGTARGARPPRAGVRTRPPRRDGRHRRCRRPRGSTERGPGPGRPPETVGLDRFLDEWLAQPLFAGLPEWACFDAERRRNTVPRSGWEPAPRRHRLHGTAVGPPREHRRPGAVRRRRERPEVHRRAHRMADARSGGLPDAGEVVVGAGHAAHLERPERVAEIVVPFCEQLVPCTAGRRDAEPSPAGTP